jgi:hypothetical protein
MRKDRSGALRKINGKFLRAPRGFFFLQGTIWVAAMRAFFAMLFDISFRVSPVSGHAPIDQDFVTPRRVRCDAGFSIQSTHMQHTWEGRMRSLLVIAFAILLVPSVAFARGHGGSSGGHSSGGARMSGGWSGHSASFSGGARMGGAARVSGAAVMGGPARVSAPVTETAIG